MINFTGKSDDYTVEIEFPYIRITHKDFPNASYQLKLESDGLVLDAVHTGRLESLFAEPNDEALTYADSFLCTGCHRFFDVGNESNINLCELCSLLESDKD